MGALHSLPLRALPLEDDLEEPHEGVDGGADLVHLGERADGVLVERLLLVDPLDGVVRLLQPLLDGAYVADVLLHHVELAVVIELVDARTQLAQLQHEALLALDEGMLAGEARRLHQLATRTRPSPRGTVRL